ncbi:MAG: bacillithiol biosynthesis BshC [Candidatus Bathyarchaeota archaeon]
MSEHDDRPAAYNIYADHVRDRKSSGLATELWGHISHTMGEAADLLPKARSEYGETSDELEALKVHMKNNMRGMGLLTGKTREAIDEMHNGVVEAGQQPNFMGGPGLVFNKISYAVSLAGMDENIVPLYYVADYDGVQPELTNMRLPSPSSKGLQLSYPVQPSEHNLSIYEFKLPGENWFMKTMEKIDSNYRGILKELPAEKRDLVQKNLDHIYSIIRNAYYSTDNVSTFSTKIIGSLVNLEADIGLPIFWFSMPETRPLFQRGFELLLKEPTRSRFIEASNEAQAKVAASGHKPGIGARDRDYVPFFLECMNPKCRRIRVELKYARNEGSTTADLHGKCPICEEEYSFSINAENPDVSEIIDWITPRVDSRQVITDSVFPIVGHIGGPGETSYYAEVIPAARKVGLPFPLFLRYSRAFYNTPWNELESSGIKKAGYPIISSEAVFNTLSEWVVARNTGDDEGLRRAHKSIEDSITSTYSRLVEQLKNHENAVAEIKQQLRNPGDRRPLIEAMKKKQGEAQIIDHYLSCCFGRFSPEKFGQEVNWMWIDLAAATGVKDVMGAYLRMYNRYTPNSSMYYINVT